MSNDDRSLSDVSSGDSGEGEPHTISLDSWDEIPVSGVSETVEYDSARDQSYQQLKETTLEQIKGSAADPTIVNSTNAFTE